MAQFDLVVRGGTISTASDTFIADIGVKDGIVTALGQALGSGEHDIDASGKWILPGGVEAHCHIEQESSMGIMTADDYRSGSISAAFGGNTTIIPFAAQHRGQSLREVVKLYHGRAEAKSVIDYTFHLIISDPTKHILSQELPALIMDGYTSFKVYMTYDMLKIDDRQFLDILTTARRYGAMTMVHAENNDVIAWMSERLLNAGHVAPRYHAVSHARIAESEASGRAIHLAELTDTPLLIVHVSTEEATRTIRKARDRGLKIYGETCPQYLFLTIDDLDREGMEGAKYCCSPPPRNDADQESIWLGLQNDTFQVFSSDHAPYRFDETGKLHAGPNPPFKMIGNGVPGIELRMPLLFSEGVRNGRISINQFVALTSTNAAKIFGLHPQKGTIAIGSDADFALWDPDREVEITWDDLHDNVGYTPYQGKRITGWPETVINRGRVVVSDGELHVDPGSGRFLRRRPGHGAAVPAGQLVMEVSPACNFGAEIL
ncbi:dihydropyrimidinase [Acidihalobacter ferrooxydans]|uniref:Dihydropyrimidinase n=1 Tax=Acidihalobacter ferrooxydans TaxID=1765967 RepID=A0A1P8UIV4_9GAMM|nr:dihydropyrimidinase [Acidihalobacter ferrooxydans]APZ43775.1 dihydropyrimidinase [Acidihalobacter ferrooxydans]